MSSTNRMLDEKNKTIRFLTLVIIALLVFLSHAHFKVMGVPNDWTFWNPPNIDVGGKTKIGIVPDVEAYNFSFLIFGNVNTWLEDGASEYDTKLKQFRYYLSEKYVSSLRVELSADKGSYRNRLRTVEYVANNHGVPIYKVKRLAHGRFEVEAVFRVKDSVSGVVIFDEQRRYFFEIRSANVNRHNNPWQLKIEREYQRYVLEKKYV